jgi:adenylate cyclase
VRVVGKEIPIKVFELLSRKGDLAPEWVKALPVYSEGVEKFLKGEFENASKEFQEALKLVPGDKPSKLYLNVCQDYMTIPPQGDWKVFNLTSK